MTPTKTSKTIRNRYGATLNAEHQQLRQRADRFLTITTNASRLLNRLGDLVTVDVPREADGNVINLYYHGSVSHCHGEREAARRRIEKTLDCTFNTKGVAEVQFSRITATVTLRVQRPRKKGLNLLKRRSRRRRAA